MDVINRMRALGGNRVKIKTRTVYSEMKYDDDTLINDLDKSTRFSSEIYQQRWKPPTMIEYSWEVSDKFPDDGVVDIGSIETDAKLVILKEKENNRIRCHPIVYMPSTLPSDATTLKKIPDIFNMVMVDVSASMENFWSIVQEEWNEQLAPNLNGRTRIYTFGSSVRFRGERTCLDKMDFDKGGTDLTGALQTIVNEVYVCQERYINVFLITDGDHNITGIEPRSVIIQMRVPRGKICSVYILGVGDKFPVNYSLEIRSRLHNGSSNIPSLFWAKERDDITRQMIDMRNSLSRGFHSFVKLIEISGYSMPGLPHSKNCFHLGEWVYFDCEPEQLVKFKVRFGSFIGFLDIEPHDATIEDIDQIFRQWNSIIIQRNNNEESIPVEIYHLMERIFITHLQIAGSNWTTSSISDRLQRKELKIRETHFRKGLQKLKTILTNTKYKNELELAENILSTTVMRKKYQLKSLWFKGHTDSDYAQNRSEFKEVYYRYLEQIKDIPVLPDDCCRITMTSTLSDLQDPDFLKLLEENDKFHFLKEFTITGIPVYAPSRDSVTMNPWTFSVRSTLKSPYTIMSQSAMESFAELKSPLGKDKMIKLKEDDENTEYNAVVPVFSPTAAKAMQPFIRTRLYAMCVTFATLKNPHIIDFDIHVASLAVTWVHCLFEYPSLPRPEHVKIRMESIEATAALYLEQPRYTKYIQVLLRNPHQALMTESQANVTVKCESLIKPMFLLYMSTKYDSTGGAALVNITETLGLLVMEYIGRCLSHYKSGSAQSTPFTDFFAEFLLREKEKMKWVKNVISDSRIEEKYGNGRMLLEKFYTFENVRTALKKLAEELTINIKEKLLTNLPLKLDVAKIEKLHNLSSAGDVSWFTLKTFGKEMGLGDAKIDSLFSEESIFISTAHALRYRASSRDRLSQPIRDYRMTRKMITEKVQKENIRDLTKIFYSELITSIENSWKEAYMDVHLEVIKPMTRPEIVRQARRKGIEVTDSTFDSIYSGYRQSFGLLGNACQVRNCPYFLIPNKSYNQHAATERKLSPGFIHGFHKVAYECRKKNINVSNCQVEFRSVVKTTLPITISEAMWTKLERDFQKLQGIYKDMAEEDLNKITFQ